MKSQTFILPVAHDLVIWFGLLRIMNSRIVSKLQVWARLLLCAFFMLGGANFSHGDELHHQPGDAYHQSIEKQDDKSEFQQHSHLDKANQNAQFNDLSAHCGSPELQPESQLTCQNVLFSEAVKPVSAPMMVGTGLGLEPPPPRT